MINIPDKVRIGSMDYKVEKSDDILILDGRQCYGMIDYIYHTISLDSSTQDEQGMEITFLHELVHGILVSVCMNEESSNEELVEKLSQGLHQVIRDNPNMFTKS